MLIFMKGEPNSGQAPIWNDSRGLAAARLAVRSALVPP